MKWLKRFDSRHPLLNVFAVVNSFNGESVGTENKNLLIVSNGNKITFFRLAKENAMLRNVWKQKFTDTSYMAARFRWINEALDMAERLSYSLAQTNFAELGNAKMHELYKEYVRIFIRIFEAYDLSQPEVAAVCEEELEKLISGKVKDSKSAIGIYSVLTTSAKTDTLKEEELGWLKILLEVKKKGFHRGVFEKIKAHSDNFGWISTQENLSFLDTNYFVKLASENKGTEEEILQKIMETESKPKDTEMGRKKILAMLNDKRVEEYSGILGMAGHLRLMTRLAWTKLEFSAKGLFREISKRANIKFESVKYIFPDEIEGMLVRGVALDSEIVNRRTKNYVMMLCDGKIEFFTGKNAKDIEAREIAEENLETNEVRGRCACPGFTRGKAKIIHSHVEDQLEEAGKMEYGDILVAGSTKPQLILACRKASAIVTDEGGITSHAATVSRELGIPCIVGTRIATKVFKDGDIIEVDATKGIARKVRLKQGLS